VFVVQLSMLPVAQTIQGVPKRSIHKVNIPYYNVYTSFLDTLYSVE
jgi:hypothetical protein